MNKNPDIGIVILDIFPKEFITNFENELTTKGLDLQINLMPNEKRYYNSADWAIPTLITIYLFQSYFSGFLQEIGKEHYLSLKKTVANKIKTLNISTTTTVDVSNEIIVKQSSVNNEQSKVLSIQFMTLNGVIVKILFNQNLAIEQLNLMTFTAFDLIEKHFTEYPNDLITEKTKQIQFKGDWLFGVINPQTIQWEFTTIIQKYKNECT